MSTLPSPAITGRHSSKTSASQRKAGTPRWMRLSMNTARNSSATTRAWQSITSSRTHSGTTLAAARRESLRLPFPARKHERRPGQYLSSKKACLAALDIGVSELDKANHQQHNRHAGHAQECCPVHAIGHRAAIQVED